MSTRFSPQTTDNVKIPLIYRRVSADYPPLDQMLAQFSRFISPSALSHLGLIGIVNLLQLVSSKCLRPSH